MLCLNAGKTRNQRWLSPRHVSRRCRTPPGNFFSVQPPPRPLPGHSRGFQTSGVWSLLTKLMRSHSHFFLSRKAPPRSAVRHFNRKGLSIFLRSSPPSQTDTGDLHCSQQSLHSSAIPAPLHHCYDKGFPLCPLSRLLPAQVSSFWADLCVKSLSASSSLDKLSRRALSLFAICIFLLHLAETGSG